MAGCLGRFSPSVNRQIAAIAVLGPVQFGFDLAGHLSDVRHAVHHSKYPRLAIVIDQGRRLTVVDLEPVTNHCGIIVRTPYELGRAAFVANSGLARWCKL